jgi:hypothetical protein
MDLQHHSVQDILKQALVIYMSGLGQGYTGYFFAFPACPVEGGDERQKSVIPLRGRELTVNCQMYRYLVTRG